MSFINRSWICDILHDMRMKRTPVAQSWKLSCKLKDPLEINNPNKIRILRRKKRNYSYTIFCWLKLTSFLKCLHENCFLDHLPHRAIIIYININLKIRELTFSAREKKKRRKNTNMNLKYIYIWIINTSRSSLIRPDKP